MRKITIFGILLITLLGITSSFTLKNNSFEFEDQNQKTFYDFKVKTIDGKDYDLNQLKGKKVIVINVASKCGLTPQYEILQKIYEKLDKSKFEIIAFPANNFLKQEPGSNEEIAEFCKKNYGVTFPIMEKVSVCDYIYKSYPATKEDSDPTTTHELYQWLTKKDLNGVLDTQIQWNFQKFLIDEDGNLVGTLSPTSSLEILA
jgi:glutathione peroxidase